MTSGRIAAVLVNWNSSADVVRTVNAIKSEYEDVAAIVVDNHSADSDWSIVEESLSGEAILSRLPSNLGYGAGVNHGFRIALEQDFDWVWLMNPDALPYPDCLHQLLARSEGCAVLGPRQLSSDSPLSDDAEQYASAVRLNGTRASHETCSGCASGQHDVAVVTGTGLLVRVPFAHEGGLMNELFFHYKEEFEFVERMTQYGAVRYVCGARLWHQRGASLSQSSPRAHYYRVRNELLYLSLRLGTNWRRKARTWRWVARSVLGAARSTAQVRAATLRGLSDGLRNRWGKAD